MTLITALGRQRQADFLVQGQPGLQSDFQDSQGYTEKLFQKNKQTNMIRKKMFPKHHRDVRKYKYIFRRNWAVGLGYSSVHRTHA